MPGGSYGDESTTRVSLPVVIMVFFEQWKEVEWTMVIDFPGLAAAVAGSRSAGQGASCEKRIASQSDVVQDSCQVEVRG